MRALLGWLRVAMIDLRGDLRHFGVLIACLALGVGTIAMVGAVGASLQSALDRDARVVLGGDLEARLSYREANDAEKALFGELGTVSEAFEFLGRGTAGDFTTFLSVRAVDENYPLLGSVGVREASAPLPELLAMQDGVNGAVVDSLLLDRLQIGVGDRFTVGVGEFEVRGILDGVPDQVTQGVALGVPVLISTAAAPSTEILEPGVIAKYRYKLLLNDGVSFADAVGRIRASFPDSGFDILSPQDATEELARFFDIFRRFLTIVGLSALLVGGVGVANAVSAYVTERQRSIATMKSLGATGARILFHFLAQTMVLTAVGIVFGSALGALLTLAVLPILGSTVGLSLTPTVDLPSLAQAGIFGVLIGFAFAYIPLYRAQAMRPALLFRAAGTAVGGQLGWRGMLRPQVALPVLIAVAGILAMAWLVTRRPEIVFWYALGVLGAFVVLRLAAYLLQQALRLVPPVRGANLRNAIKAIYRPGAPAPTVVLSLGLGLALLLLISLIDNNLRNQLDTEVMTDAPTFVYMDLFDDEVAEFERLTAEDDRIESFDATPLIRGTITAVNGAPAPALEEPPEDISALFDGEFPLTYSAVIPSGSRVVAGEWWAEDYSGPALVSVSTQIRELMNLAVGDVITFSIFGAPTEATIANFREYSWQGGGINFSFVLSPGSIGDAPVTFFGMLKTAPGAEDEVQSELIANYPDLIFIPVAEALESVSALIGTVSNAVAVIGGIALISGLLVLAGALAAGRRQREADAVVSKVLGATRGDVTRAYIIEYGLVGALSAVFAAILGVGGAWAFVTQVLESPFRLDWVLLAIVIVSASLLTIAVGAATTWSALSVRPAPFLREE